MTAGDPAFLRGDLRWASSFGAGWFFKLVGNYQDGEYFTRSRHESTEYAGLPTELLPLSDNGVGSGTIAVRLDKHFESGSLLTLEPGFQKLSGNPVAVAFPGRFNLTEPIEQKWLRLDFTSRRFEARAYYTDRQAPEFVDLSTGGSFFDDSQRRHLEILAHDEFGRLRLVGGASYRTDDIGHALVRPPRG